MCRSAHLRSQTHYYIVKEGENTIYIGTNASKEPDVGELRFIARLNKSAVPNGTPESVSSGLADFRSSLWLSLTCA